MNETREVFSAQMSGKRKLSNQTASPPPEAAAMSTPIPLSSQDSSTVAEATLNAMQVTSTTQSQHTQLTQIPSPNDEKRICLNFFKVIQRTKSLNFCFHLMILRVNIDAFYR